MKVVVIVAVVLVTAAAGPAAQDPLTTAKDLYASAAYEDALSALDRIESPVPPETARQADEYRAFCLFALGRTGEAEAVAEAIIRREPLAKLNAVDVSPRLELMFAGVRKRLLPGLVRDRFRLARTAFEQKDFTEAESQLVEARLIFVEATRIGVSDDTLGDFNLLIDGFLQLIRTNAEQRPPVPRPAAPASTAPAPVSAPAAPVTTRSAVSRASAVPSSAPRVYSAEDKDVVPPVTIEQRMPTLSDEMKLIAKVWQVGGTLTIVIDETGRVTEAVVRPPLSSSFDSLIVSTARQWRYVPAKKDGVAVRYLKIMALVP